MPLIIVALGVVLLILLITKFKLNTFVSLVITAFVVGLFSGTPLTKLPTIITTGIGDQLGELAIIFGMGSMIGKLVSDSGGGYRIAHTLIAKFGQNISRLLSFSLPLLSVWHYSSKLVWLFYCQSSSSLPEKSTCR